MLELEAWNTALAWSSVDDEMYVVKSNENGGFDFGIFDGECEPVLAYFYGGEQITI